MRKDVSQEEIEEKYNEWKEGYTFEEPLPDSVLCDWIQEEIEKYKKMTTEEYTLYKKWIEINSKWGKRANKNVGLFFGKNPEVPEIKYVKNRIWQPSSVDDYKYIEPELMLTKGEQDEKYDYDLIWSILRVFLSTMIFNPNIGRSLYYVARDKITKKFLGVIQISGDFMDLTPRDNYIGWSREWRTYSGKLNNTAIGATIVPTQPLGYNYLGGKLLALLCTSDRVENDWKENYEDPLVGITTTSLYGSFSQYNNLKYWKKCGKSKGSVPFEPSYDLIQEIFKRLAWYYPFKYYEATRMRRDFRLIKRDYKNRNIKNIFLNLGFKEKDVVTNFERGIYFCKLFENTEEFLRGEIEENQLKRRFDNSINTLTELWKEKYASKRIKNLQEQERTNFSLHFYDELLYLDWEETKQKYLKDVGR